MEEIIFREVDVTIPEKGKRLVPLQELIRCMDCKHWYKDECSHLCGLTGDFRNADFFCADGERKE